MKTATKVAAVMAASLLSAGVAYAVPAQLNIYGASAQGDFWTSESYPFLTNLGCKAADGVTALPTGDATNNKIVVNTDGPVKVKYSYAIGYNCSNTAVPQDSDDTHTPKYRNLEIRTGGIASLEGPLAITKQSPIEPVTDCTPAVPGSRLMAKNATITALSDLGCYPTHVGTTDLDVANITQQAFKADFSNYPMPAVPLDMTGTTDQIPTGGLVVPFSIAVNTAVKAQHCYDTVTATGVSTKMSGFYCTDVSQCGSPLAGHTRSCGALETIDNVSRLQVVNLFSGTVANWQDIDKGFVNLPVTLCIRQPGSGSLAAFEKTVMTAGDALNVNNNLWGAPFATTQNITGPALPYVNFIKTSDNMVDCINNTAGVANQNGAVGFVDGDKNGNVLAANAVKVNYNGNFPSRINIRKGIYDYYTAGHMYTPALVAPQSAIVPLLVSFVKDPRNIPGTITTDNVGHVCVAPFTDPCPEPWTFTETVGSKATWWATVGEMKFMRSTDLDYPAKVTPLYTVNP